MSIKLTSAQAKALGVTAKGTRRTRGEMNRNESAYAEHLRLLTHAGEVVWFAFEAIKLRLADNTTLTVDFVVMLRDGTIEFVDVKGYKKKANGDPGYWALEDSKIKLKIAAEMFPFVFRVVFQDKQKTWHSVEI